MLVDTWYEEYDKFTLEFCEFETHIDFHQYLTLSKYILLIFEVKSYERVIGLTFFFLKNFTSPHEFWLLL